LFREGLARILAETEFRVVGSGPSLHDVDSGSLPQHQPILLVIDAGDDLVAMAAQIASFKERYPAGRVGILADRRQLGDIVATYRAGAHAVFAKAVARDAFLKVLELVMLGETFLPSEVLAHIRGRPREDTRPSVPHREEALVEETSRSGGSIPPLSSRERSILRCILEGASNKVIARKIDIAEATVKVHVKTILRKIRVHNRTQAAIWAMNNSPFLQAASGGAPPPGPPQCAGPESAANNLAMATNVADLAQRRAKSERA
jgi:two-component system nitrate/nitrite response regulator NarL